MKEIASFPSPYITFEGVDFLILLLRSRKSALCLFAMPIDLCGISALPICLY